MNPRSFLVVLLVIAAGCSRQAPKDITFIQVTETIDGINYQAEIQRDGSVDLAHWKDDADLLTFDKQFSLPPEEAARIFTIAQSIVEKSQLSVPESDAGKQIRFFTESSDSTVIPLSARGKDSDVETFAEALGINEIRFDSVMEK